MRKIEKKLKRNKKKEGWDPWEQYHKAQKQRICLQPEQSSAALEVLGGRDSASPSPHAVQMQG